MHFTILSKLSQYNTTKISPLIQAYGLDFYFAQSWIDQRFVSKDHSDCVVNMIGKEVDKVWLPDTVFVNSKSSKFHDVTVNNRFLSINMNDGSVMYHIR